MNNRILELAEQAGIAVWGDAVYMYHPGDTLDATVLAKFTELIVQECMKLNSKELSITAIERLLPLYKEHFGVEE
jgi:hypothetical protein